MPFGLLVILIIVGVVVGVAMFVPSFGQAVSSMRTKSKLHKMDLKSYEQYQNAIADKMAERDFALALGHDTADLDRTIAALLTAKETARKSLTS